MPDRIVVTGVSFVAACPALELKGLLGWASVRFNVALQINGVTVRRTRDGHLALSFPVRVDGRSRSRPIVQLDNNARGEIERQVLGELRRQGRLAS